MVKYDSSDCRFNELCLFNSVNNSTALYQYFLMERTALVCICKLSLVIGKILLYNKTLCHRHKLFNRYLNCSLRKSYRNRIDSYKSLILLYVVQTLCILHCLFYRAKAFYRLILVIYFKLVVILVIKNDALHILELCLVSAYLVCYPVVMLLCKSQIIRTKYHILSRNSNRMSVLRLQQVVGAEHKESCLGLSLR